MPAGKVPIPQEHGIAASLAVSVVDHAKGVTLVAETLGGSIRVLGWILCAPAPPPEGQKGNRYRNFVHGIVCIGNRIQVQRSGAVDWLFFSLRRVLPGTRRRRREVTGSAVVASPLPRSKGAQRCLRGRRCCPRVPS